jgi:hypothetical protein
MMDNREQQQRERAYKIWEDAGRPHGLHDDHWNKAEEQHEMTEQESDDVTKVNQEADREFADHGTNDVTDTVPSSAIKQARKTK